MGMSVHNAHPAPARARATVARIRVLDRLFLGGCIATYLVLLGAVIAALKAYGL
jgi:hypothetical protein